MFPERGREESASEGVKLFLVINAAVPARMIYPRTHTHTRENALHLQVKFGITITRAHFHELSKHQTHAADSFRRLGGRRGRSGGRRRRWRRKRRWRRRGSL
jgi:hypothetical protein